MIKPTKVTRHVRRQLAYEELVRRVNKNSQNFLVVSVQYYLTKNPIHIICHLFAFIIALSAIVKSRGNKIVHSAYIYKFGPDPRIVEAVGSGYNHAGLYKYFRPGFKGRVYIHSIPANISKYKRSKNIKFVEHKKLGAKYGVVKAMRSWFDGLFRNHKDSKDETFCSDSVIDAYERITKKELVKNNAQWEPSELFNLFIERDYELLYVIDSNEI
jgi:hypothetical protein